MICFDVALNGKRVTRAGIPGYAVLNTDLIWVRPKPRLGARARRPDLRLRVGGLDSNVPDWEDGIHLDWCDRKLKPGDRISVRILEAEDVDPPAPEMPRLNQRQLEALKARSRRFALSFYRKQQKYRSSADPGMPKFAVGMS
jgi:hypothetical protein